ncbi:unnamed protein product [Rotaria sp. Silwood2]|nr:unnamed protein product [Rotaria sp. Silwood2]CAF3473728.1 unnamed protein product [Rotaria sp. Silwood2]CAF4553957.1 unnamed protein product [Rotaria sp. Silwood2]CAF4576040.1 unnamed protein product [Rotaria sp. Silwood2]CAF4646642.1 unnamed protein product [Rotaria sp. Silwood2]
MSQVPSQNSTFDEIDKLLADPEFCQALQAWQDNTEKFHFIIINGICQTMNDALAVIRQLMETTVAHEHKLIDQPLPAITVEANLIGTVDLSSSPSHAIDLCTTTPVIVDLCTPTPATIDLCTPTAAIIDLCTPSTLTIDLCSPEITSNTNSTDSPLRLSPK